MRRRIAITGAAGFIGRETSAVARRDGHHVVAIVRPETNADRLSKLDQLGCEIANCGLDNADRLAEAVRGCDAVIHLAVSSAATDRAAIEETVGSSKRLIDAMSVAGVPRLVMASSFAVYDYQAIPTGSLVDESSPTVSAESARDWYSKAKVQQEDLARGAATAHEMETAVLRLGAVYGPGRTWTGRLGARVGRIWFCIGSDSEVPVLHVSSAAEYLIRAATCDHVPSTPINVLDGSPPTQRDLRRAFATQVHPRPIIVAVPWGCARLVGAVAWRLTSVLPALRQRLPALLRPSQQAARFKPLRYASTMCCQALGWQSGCTLAEALADGLSDRVPDATCSQRSSGASL